MQTGTPTRKRRRRTRSSLQELSSSPEAATETPAEAAAALSALEVSGFNKRKQYGILNEIVTFPISVNPQRFHVYPADYSSG